VLFATGLLISAIAGKVTIALALAPPFVIPFMMFGGFFLHDEYVHFDYFVD
jgi:hypothetical protein